MRIVRAALRGFRLPLVAPLATAHGPIAERVGLLVTLEDEDGRVGLGEATPLPDFGGEDLAACRAALATALPALVDGAARSFDEALARVAPSFLPLPASHPTASPDAPCARPVARAALEAALASLAAQRAGVSLAAWIRERAGLPGPPAAEVRIQALVPGSTPESVAAAARRALAEGFTVFKLKVGSEPLEHDLARVAALRAAIGPTARIRLDANEAWTRAEAEQALARLAPFGIELVEQPVARTDLDALAALDRAGAIPIAADEALLGDGLEACLARRAARIFVVKSAVLGGIGPTIALAARARAAGIRLVHSNLIEGRVGRETATAIAAALALPGPEGEVEVHGLGTAALLARDLDPDAPASAAADDTVDPDALEFDAGWLARWGRSSGSPDRAALVFEGRRFDSAALQAAVERAERALAAAGLEAGELVAVLAPPSPAGVALIHAMLERRVVLLPLNARWTEAELAGALAATRPAALVVTDALEGGLAARLAQAGGGRGFVLVTPPEAEPLRVELRVQPSAPTRPPAALAARGAALVLLTSGTSGTPKAAILTRANLIASARASAALLGSAATDRWLLCMPLFHIAGLSILVRAALAGACVVLESRFDAARVARILDEERITHASLVAASLEALLDARGARPTPSALRLVLLGGGPASDALIERALAAGYPIAPTYGLTEAASQVATRPPRGLASLLPPGAPDVARPDLGERALAGGLVPLPGTVIRIVDGEDRPLAAGCEGEIQVRGPSVMAGYLDDPAATARTLRGGWLATGDFGRLDAAGRLRVLDRRSDLIVSGGENVYPAELEGVIAAHPDVLEAGVVGVPDAPFGARPLAFVVGRPGVAPDPAALAAWCRERLAGFKQPVGFVVVEALPRNASGKLLRRALAERFGSADASPANASSATRAAAEPGSSPPLSPRRP
ncbi:MAG: o-succinylbenzoate synthase [Myxococcota bacterium]